MLINFSVILIPCYLKMFSTTVKFWSTLSIYLVYNSPVKYLLVSFILKDDDIFILLYYTICK